MSEDGGLLEAALETTAVEGGETYACWTLVIEAIAAGWIDWARLRALLLAVRRGEPFVVEALRLAVVDGRIEGTLGGERRACAAMAFGDLVCAVLATDPSGAHPGSIVHLDGEEVVSVRSVDEVPEPMRFAPTARGLVPVVKVIRRAMSDTMHEILEHGPRGELLRTTVLRRG